MIVNFVSRGTTLAYAAFLIVAAQGITQGVKAQSVGQAQTALQNLLTSKEADRPAFGRISGKLLALGPNGGAPYGALVHFNDRVSCSVDVAACKTELYVLQGGSWRRVASIKTQEPEDVKVSSRSTNGYRNIRFQVMLPPAATRRANVWLRWDGSRYIEHKRVMR